MYPVLAEFLEMEKNQHTPPSKLWGYPVYDFHVPWIHCSALVSSCSKAGLNEGQLQERRPNWAISNVTRGCCNLSHFCPAGGGHTVWLVMQVSTAASISLYYGILSILNFNVKAQAHWLSHFNVCCTGLWLFPLDSLITWLILFFFFNLYRILFTSEHFCTPTNKYA